MIKQVNNNLLTPKQKKILTYLQSYFSQHGYAPSYKEISSEFNLKSDGSIGQYLDALEEKGYIDRGDGSRQIYLTSIKEKLTQVFVLGTIAAGNPIEPIENPEPISIPEGIIPPNSLCYALRVSGDSMIDDGIADNDLILVKHQNTASNGDIIVAITENGATLKRFYKENNQIRLEPRNERLSIIYPLELEIRGRFIGLIRTNS